MAASFIDSFIAAQEGATREQALRAFLEMPRVRDWVGTDPARRERILGEFNRAWESAHPAPAARAPAPAAAPARAAPEPVGGLHVAGGRIDRSVMCPRCGSMNLHAHLMGDAVAIRCAGCGTVHKDLLALIPVREVGPFAFLFGEGWQGAARAAGLLLALAALYGVLKWLS